MKIDKERNEEGKDVAVIQLEGRLDAQHSDNIEEELLKLIDEGSVNLVIDMEKVEFLGSSGIRVLLAVNNKLDKINSKMKILNLPETGIKILRTMEIIDRFNLYQSKKEAVDSF